MKKKAIYLVVLMFVMVNIVAFNHAYHFSNFDIEHGEKTNKPEELSFLSTLRILFTGVSNPKPKNTLLPDRQYETVKIKTHHD